LHRAALALGSVNLPTALWSVLTRAPNARRVDLNRLADGASAAEWIDFFAVTTLFKRLRSRQAASALTSYLEGLATPRADLLAAVNLDPAELDGALQLLGVADTSADPAELPSHVSFGQLQTMLELVDRARRFNLPSTALARWHEADPSEIYEWAVAALRVGLEPSEWLGLLAEVTDPVRKHLRDAQLDLLVALHQQGLTGTVDFS